MNPRLALLLGRILWLLVGVSGWFAVGAALDGRATGAAIACQVVCWLLFAAGVVALVVPSTVSLTALRIAAPLAPIAGVLCLAGGAGAAKGAAFLAAGVLAVAVIGSGELGEAFAQASAYGDEHRFPLRPPVGFLLAVVVAWSLWAALLTVGTVLLAHSVWVVGAGLTVVALAAAWPLAVRCHRLSRRWLVVVPAGLVVHDHLVLAETLLVQRNQLARVGLALAGTGAADLTGPSGGHPVEIALHESLKVALAATRRDTAGRAIHALAFLVAPARPGRALTRAASFDLPVAS